MTSRSCPTGPRLHAQKSAIIWSIVTPLQCPSCEPITLAAWVRVMGLLRWKIKLCFFFVYELVWLCCPSTTSVWITSDLARNTPSTVHFPLPCANFIKEALVSLSYFIKNSVLQIPLPDKTIRKFFILKVFVHICLPQSLTDWKKLSATLSHCTVHRIYICPYKRSWWWIHPLMYCSMDYSWLI